MIRTVTVSGFYRYIVVNCIEEIKILINLKRTLMELKK